MTGESTASCSWCGSQIEPGDGWRAEEVPGERRAAFCRLEHIVPWTIQGTRWEAGELVEPGGLTEDLEACAHCGAVLGDVHVVLVRHRGEHRIPDAFCSAEHLSEWAKSGGRYG